MHYAINIGNVTIDTLTLNEYFIALIYSNLMIDQILPVTITDKALVEVKHIMSNKKIPEGYGLRIGMKGGGCGGMSFVLGFDKVKETDNVFTEDGVEIFIQKKDTMYLLGMSIDFVETSESRGFSFSKEG